MWSQVRLLSEAPGQGVHRILFLHTFTRRSRSGNTGTACARKSVHVPRRQN